MALLEDAAQQLYGEWFVRLRFPGYEHMPVANGIPEGWAATSIGLLRNVCESGGLLASSEASTGKTTHPWVSSAEVIATRLYRYSAAYLRDDAAANSSTVLGWKRILIVRTRDCRSRKNVALASRRALSASNQEI